MDRQFNVPQTEVIKRRRADVRSKHRFTERKGKLVGSGSRNTSGEFKVPNQITRRRRSSFLMLAEAGNYENDLFHELVPGPIVCHHSAILK